MNKPLRAAMLFCLLTATVAPALAQSAADPMRRAAVEQAVWPGDIVRAADQYLRANPEADDAAEVQDLRRRAGDAWQLVSRNDVRLYRSAFTPRDGGETLHDMRQAALGDRDAAVRLAHASRRIDEVQGTQRYVGWLQLASMLGDQRASYELALHFRRTDQPVLAARYEAVALAAGYQPAPGLDHARK